MKRKKVFLSVYGKTLKFNALVVTFHDKGYELIASGGTYRHIKNELGLEVTHAAEITKLKPIEGKENVLDHRVETLCPEIHGALLADDIRHMEELEKLGWPFIDAVVCTFYPLAKTMEEKAGDYEAINKEVDIGGPAMTRSGTKGGRAVIVDENDFDWVMDKLDSNDGHLSKTEINWLKVKAAAWVTQYTATEVIFRLNQIRPE